MIRSVGEPDEYRTASGHVLTDTEIAVLAAEAEAGYSVDDLVPAPHHSRSLRRVATVRWRKHDDDPQAWHLADFSELRDAEMFANLLSGHSAVNVESIQVEGLTRISP